MAKENYVIWVRFSNQVFNAQKIKKINLSPAFLKLETLLFQNMFLLFYLILYSQIDFDSKKKKSGLREKKHAIYPLLMPFHKWYLPY